MGRKLSEDDRSSRSHQAASGTLRAQRRRAWLDLNQRPSFSAWLAEQVLCPAELHARRRKQRRAATAEKSGRIRAAIGPSTSSRGLLRVVETAVGGQRTPREGDGLLDRAPRGRCSRRDPSSEGVARSRKTTGHRVRIRRQLSLSGRSVAGHGWIRTSDLLSRL